MKFKITEPQPVNKEEQDKPIKVSNRKVVQTLEVHEISTVTGVIGKNIYVPKFKVLNLTGDIEVGSVSDVEIEVLDERVHIE